ncbi:hypothetical protein HDU88_008332 [Geranomyces variabilis]|nr:hypothetical protein HDU88_008332 [Geranomyces variabilis]
MTTALCTSVVQSSFTPDEHPNLAVTINTRGMAQEEVTYGNRRKYGYKGIFWTGRKYMLKGGASLSNTALHATPLHFAVVCSNAVMVRRLLENGAIPGIKSGAGVSAVEMAEANGLEEIAALLSSPS